MSDFDKEAEREKLRKKFARDEQKRAETQRMSELLLKGATMTNKHCDRCSDPLFRYNGQTFCPSCQADADTTAEPDHQSAESTQQTQPDAESTADQSQPVDQSESVDQSQPADRSQLRDQAEPVDAVQSVDRTHPVEPPETQSTQRSQTHQPQSSQPSTDASSRQPARPAPPTEGLAAARQSLERTVTRFARRAEETEDPRRARELLTAAHEAAATLSELE